jgi:hypothetical protein
MFNVIFPQQILVARDEAKRSKRSNTLQSLAFSLTRCRFYDFFTLVTVRPTSCGESRI